MKKRMIAAGLLAGLCTVFVPSAVDSPWQMTASACEEGKEARTPFCLPLAYSSEVVTETLRDKQDGKLMIEAKTYAVTLSGKYAEYYPQLQQTLTRISKEKKSQLHKLLRNWKQDFQSIYEQRKQAMPADTSTPFSYENSFMGLRADSHVFSFASSAYSYFGGAHPTLYYDAMTIDTRTGKVLKLTDVLQKTAGFAAVIADEAIAQQEYRDQLPERSESIRLIQEMIDSDSLVFGLDNDGMKVYFGNYALGSYAMGTMVVTVPYKTHAEFFCPQYVFTGIMAKG